MLNLVLDGLLKQIKDPKFVGDGWLTEAYIKVSGWYPISEDGRSYLVKTRFGQLPCRSRSEYRAGDVIVFDEFSDQFDRIHIVTEEDIKEYEEGKRDMLPCGVVVHRPSVSIDSRFIDMMKGYNNQFNQN